MTIPGLGDDPALGRAAAVSMPLAHARSLHGDPVFATRIKINDREYHANIMQTGTGRYLLTVFRRRFDLGEWLLIEGTYRGQSWEWLGAAAGEIMRVCMRDWGLAV